MQINVFIVIAILVRRLCSFVSFYNKIYLIDEQSFAARTASKATERQMGVSSR